MTGPRATPAAAPPGQPAPAADLERSIARLLTVGTYASVALLVFGVVLMLANGIGPRSGGPVFDSARLGPDLMAFRPAGFIWLGLIAVVATPAARVLASLVGYARRGERTMVIVAALILLVIALSVVLSGGLEA
jgi:uncharacterized membrane protein